MTQPQLPLAPPTRYDQAARYLLTRAGGPLFGWLLGSPDRLRFRRWLPTQLTLPNAPQRLCDAVAELTDPDRGGVPVAALLEVQTQPDATMPGRLMLAGGLLWLTVKPTELPGDRYELLGVVINLTGTGDAARRCEIGTAEWTLRPVEVNLEALDAGTVLGQVAGGDAPRELLAFIPLMQRGGDDDIIRKWQEAVVAEPDSGQRAGYALALVFASKVNRSGAWRKAVDEIWADSLDEAVSEEAPFIAELIAKADARGLAKGLAEGEAKGLAEGKAEGEAKAKAETLLRVLEKRFGTPPAEVAAAVRGCADPDQLGRWLDAALDADSLTRFREQAGL